MRLATPTSKSNTVGHPDCPVAYGTTPPIRPRPRPTGTGDPRLGFRMDEVARGQRPVDWGWRVELRARVVRLSLTSKPTGSWLGELGSESTRIGLVPRRVALYCRTTTRIKSSEQRSAGRAFLCRLVRSAPLYARRLRAGRAQIARRGCKWEGAAGATFARTGMMSVARDRGREGRPGGSATIRITHTSPPRGTARPQRPRRMEPRSCAQKMRVRAVRA